MIEKLRVLRLNIDTIAQLCSRCGPEKPTREVQQCIDSLFIAKAWLGKLLGLFNEKSPYSNDGKRNTVKDIEPTDARAMDITMPEEWMNMTYIAKIDDLREAIKNRGQDMEEMLFETGTRMMSIYRTQAQTHLTEARFWLGFELERIKKHDDEYNRSKV